MAFFDWWGAPIIIALIIHGIAGGIGWWLGGRAVRKAFEESNQEHDDGERL